MTDPAKNCPECGIAVEGIAWEGGCVKVYEHKGMVPEKIHHFRLVVENNMDRMDRSTKGEQSAA
jgi:hypothetical protein